MVWEKGLESLNINQDLFMKETSKKGTSMEKVKWSTRQRTSMKETGKKTKKMASELCTGLREQTKNTTVNGRTINKMVLVFISGLKTEEKTNISETDMKVTGKMAKEKD